MEREKLLVLSLCTKCLLN